MRESTHTDKTAIDIDDSIALNLSAVNGVSLPAMTLQMVLRVPVGWTVTGMGFAYAKLELVFRGGQGRCELQITFDFHNDEPIRNANTNSRTADIYSRARVASTSTSQHQRYIFNRISPAVSLSKPSWSGILGLTGQI